MVKLCIVELLEVYWINEKEKKLEWEKVCKKDENMSLKSKKKMSTYETNQYDTQYFQI